MRSKNILFLTFLLFNFLIINAQQETMISLEEALTKVENNNYTIKISEQDYLAAKADFNQTNSILLPNISLSHSGISTNNPLMAFGSKLNQEILTQADFNPSLLNDPDNINNFTTKIEFQQHLGGH